MTTERKRTPQSGERMSYKLLLWRLAGWILCFDEERPYGGVCLFGDVVYVTFP